MYNTLLKDAVAAIEEKEGRNVGIIKRKIVVRPNIKGTKNVRHFILLHLLYKLDRHN